MKQMKVGGVSALILTAIYLIGIVMQGTFLNMSQLTGASDKLTFISGKVDLMILWITLLYIVFGIFLILLTVTLHDVVIIHNGYLGRLILGFGFVWASLVVASGMIYNTGILLAVDQQSVIIYEVAETIHLAIGGNNEIIGALWMLITVIAGIRYRLFPKWISLIGLTSSLGGVMTMVPVLYDMFIMIFALGQMIWWIGLGIHLIRKKVVYA